MSKSSLRLPDLSEQQLLERVEVRLLGPDKEQRTRYRELMERHHYLKSDALVGEQLRHVAEVDGRWVALLSWSAAAGHLKDREQWLGWSNGQRRRLALMANNARFLILPGVDCPNLASRVLALCCARLGEDWREAYAHPVLAVESFVDSQLFRGTCYKAQGWELLGHTTSNEIPAARQLLEKIGPLDGKLVMLDALHTCQETLRRIHQDNGADYLLPVKGNHATLQDLAAIQPGQRKGIPAFPSAEILTKDGLQQHQQLL